MHQYLSEGMDEQEYYESKENLVDLISEYQ
jgi:hypothetical protein